LTGRFAVDVRLEILSINPSLHIIIRSDARHSARCVQWLLSLVLKPDFSIGSLLTNKPALVNEMVMMPAKHDEVVQPRFATIGPVLYVVSIDKSGVGTARKATSFVSDA
jgi:hypothetical protein